MERPKILVIEDNSSDVFLLRRFLKEKEGQDFEIEVAEDGETALELIRSQDGNPKLHPGVILLDLHIPQHDGFEILRAIRGNPVLSDIPVLVSSNGMSPQEEDELRSMGVDYRLKPRDLGEFAKLAGDLVTLCGKTGI